MPKVVHVDPLSAATNQDPGDGQGMGMVAIPSGGEVRTATVGSPLASSLRSMSARTIQTVVAIALTIGGAIVASLLAGKPDARAGQGRQDSSRSARVDSLRFERIVPGGRDEPMFVDLDTAHFLSPPFALEPVDRGRPLALPNLAFPERLKDWVRFQGIDAAVQTDGRVVTLIGLEMEDGDPLPESNEHRSLTSAKALECVNRTHLQRSRRDELKSWPLSVRTFETVDRPHVLLPFLTREGGLGFLHVMNDLTNRRGPDGIRLTYQVEHGRDLRFQGASRFEPARRIPAPAILDDPAGPVHLQTWKGGIVLTRPGNPEWIEIDQGKVVVKVNRSGRSGPDETPVTLIEASRLVTDVMDLDGRRLRATLIGPSKSLICRRVRDRLSIEVSGSGSTAFYSDRIVVDLPNFRKLLIDPRIDGVRIKR